MIFETIEHQAARIRELEAEIELLQQNCILQPDGKIFVPDGHPELERLREVNNHQAARIRGLEGWLVEERAQLMLSDASCPGGADGCTGLANWDDLFEFIHNKEYESQTYFCNLASEQLQAEGKIGSGERVSGSTKLMPTNEQRGALEYAIEIMEDRTRDDGEIYIIGQLRSLLQAMLEEARQ